MKPGRAHLLSSAAFAALTLALLALLVSQITTADLARLARRLSAGRIALLCGLYALAVFFRAVRLACVLRDQPLPRLTAISGLYTFLNHVLPFRLGELSLPVLVKACTPRGLVAGSFSLIVTRLYDVASIALLMLLSLAVVFRELEAPLARALSGALLAVVAGLVLSFRFLPALVAWAARAAAAVLGRAGARGHAAAGRVAAAGERLRAELQGLTPRQRYLDLPATSLAVQLSIYTFFYLTMRGMGLDIGFFKNMLASSGELIAGLLPNFFGSFGTLEAGWAAGYVLCGVSRADAIATGFILHGLIILSGGLLSVAGAAYLWLARRRAGV